MSVPERGVSEVDDHPALSFQRTVDRSLVHRTAIAEVFVVDSIATGDRQCEVGAQLPLTHGYYSDHLAEPARYDPILLLEICRQAAIYGSHAIVGVSLGTAMIIGSFTLRLHNDGLRTGSRPGDLVLVTTYRGEPTKRGRVRNAGVSQDLVLDGTVVGRHEMKLTALRDSELEALRRHQRGATPPSTADYQGHASGHPVPSHLVGRRDPRNVVLTDLRRGDGGVTATVSPYFGNNALFDHEYDHLPAMVITEAARQAATATVDDGTGALVRNHVITGITASFEHYAELDQKLVASTSTRAMPDGANTVDVAFSQGSSRVAEISLEIVSRRGGE
ncbi:hypothetical protein BS329_13820 [Amycolatopsis coloradensis]|uniref:A-factor biosynthesis hotdog domain-containing protein n=1 Tax=Amycolatopsis coloradensis TaxID=76021 RepID=A0A1R0KUS4_9PSEU|nr:AfsA-related hotdog domain-containing protein [Amycolatopsis coloradensis]OLZ52397.1 hypothetical protein BS329_13820 [Amycolatopsis coloradensis]